MEQLSQSKIDALVVLPGADELLTAVAHEQGVYLVGGAVRDLLVGGGQIDYDLAVEGDAAAHANRVADKLGGTAKHHERFGTATVVAWDGRLTVDFAATRCETYSAPGALPDVHPADLATDLLRRDFTINAMAVAIWSDHFGELHQAPGARDDLAAKKLRVMHDNSFIDDPTRLLRLLRYGPRLGFAAEPKTELLARAAIMAGAPRTVSGPRIRDELLDLLGERTAVWSIDAMSELGLDRGLHAEFRADEYHAGRAILELRDGIQQDLLLLAVCCREMDLQTLEAWLEHIALPAASRDAVTDAVNNHRSLVQELSGLERPSEIAAILNRRHPETAALAASLPDTDPELRNSIRSWFDHRSKEFLLIGGSDLRGAGVAEGPPIGRALSAVLARAIDGELDGREEQLKFAIAIARENGDYDDPN